MSLETAIDMLTSQESWPQGVRDLNTNFKNKVFEEKRKTLEDSEFNNWAMF